MKEKLFVIRKIEDKNIKYLLGRNRWIENPNNAIPLSDIELLNDLLESINDPLAHIVDINEARDEYYKSAYEISESGDEFTILVDFNKNKNLMSTVFMGKNEIIDSDSREINIGSTIRFIDHWHQPSHSFAVLSIIGFDTYNFQLKIRIKLKEKFYAPKEYYVLNELSNSGHTLKSVSIFDTLDAAILAAKEYKDYSITKHNRNTCFVEIVKSSQQNYNAS